MIRRILHLFVLLFVFRPHFVASDHRFLIYYGSDAPLVKLSAFQSLVLEPDHYTNVFHLQNMVYGYLSLGEVHKTRPYFAKAKPFLGAVNPNWPDAHFVSLKGGHWQKLVLHELIPQILQKGYKGLFLDTVESLQVQHKDAEILALIAQIKRRYPRIRLMLNRAMNIANEAKVDSILLESTLVQLDWKTKKHSYVSNPQRYQFRPDLEIFSLDYWPLSDKAGIERIHRKAQEFGYTSLVSNLALTHVPEIKTKTTSLSPVDRRILILFDSSKNQDSQSNMIHKNLESVFNYYGYFGEYFDLGGASPLPENYAQIAFWQQDPYIKSPQKFYEWMLKMHAKGSKILWIGPWPSIQGQPKLPVVTEVENAFGFRATGNWAPDCRSVRVVSKVTAYDYEAPLNIITMGEFEGNELLSADLKPWLELDSRSRGKSTPVFQAPWGVFAQGEKILYKIDNIKRWLVDPYRLVRAFLPAVFPVPDLSTIGGKRVFYSHIDGDAAMSFSSVVPKNYTPAVYLQKIAPLYPYKTGISFIGFEIDPVYRGNKVLQGLVKDVFALPFVEAASHTYSHPYSWANALVAFSKNKNAVPALYGAGIKAFQEPDKQINLEFEIDESIKFLSQFLPAGKKIESIYWSGDCKPTAHDLKYLADKKILAMNGGDSISDIIFDSLSYVAPISRYVEGQRQIFSSNANDNIYTDLWTRNFWDFRRLIQTFQRTGSPRRISPLNLYYHFYCLEKIASYEALVAIYQWLDLQKEQLCNIYPSEYIRKAHNFFSLNVQRLSSKSYKITNATHLKEFRLEGQVFLKNRQNVESTHYDKAQNVTYITLGQSAEAAFEVGP